jgi:peptidyl-prolyl cis-trans isomerase D
MSIIQSIRDKGAKLAVVLIALALLGFIAMDALTGRSNLFGSNPSNTVGSVNGKSIEFNDFRSAVAQQENYMKQQGYPTGETTTQQAVESAWEQEISKTLLQEEVDRLGIDVSSKELSNSVLFGANPPQDLKQQFTDPATGVFDAQKAAASFKEMQKKGTAEQKANINAYLDQLQFGRMAEKYSSLFTNSINFPKWMVEQQIADGSQIAKISLVRKSYAEIADSSVKVTDDEINAYIGKHKTDYKQEENRSIMYVSFSAAPSAADSLDAKNSLEAMRPEFDTVQNVSGFLAAKGEPNYYDSYISGKVIQVTNKDSIFKTPVGKTYGPYLDGNSYSLAKVVGVRTLADSVKVRHILIATSQQNPQTGEYQQIRDTADARHLMDSVRTLLASGQSFDSVAAHLSEDPGSNKKGGVYTITSGQMVAPFNDFAFTHPVGTKDLVITDFGYHYMEVLNVYGAGNPAYKVAYIHKQILASAETDRDAKAAASAFAVDVNNEATFNDVFDKKWKPKGYVKGFANEIRPIAYDIQGLGASRDFVRKIYDTKRGKVLQPERVGEAYVVAVVTEVNDEGTKTAAQARNLVEPLLRNHKKAEVIKKQLGTISSLEAAAGTLGKSIEVIDSVRMVGTQPAALGYEPKVIGASFNPANRNKVVNEAIEGGSGVYVLRVDNVSATPSMGGDVNMQRQAMAMQARQRASPPIQGLRAAASIKDSRAKHY